MFIKRKLNSILMISILILSIMFATSPPLTTLASDTQDGIYNVKQFGAVGDGVTDDTQAILSAISSAANIVGGKVILPAGKYKVTSTITVPGLISLEGVNQNTAVGLSSVSIVGSLSLSPVVQLNGGIGSCSTSLKGVTVTREEGPIPAGSIGILVASTDYTVMEDVNICRHAIGYKITGNLGLKAYRVTSYAATQAYCVIEDIPQPTFVDCSFGRNGGELGVGSPTSFVEVWDDSDTLTFLRCQFNSTASSPSTNGIVFKSFNNPNGIVYITDCHMENAINAITSDASTPQIQRLLISNSTFNVGYTYNFINLHWNTAAIEWCFSNNEVTGITTLINGAAISITGNRLVGPFNVAVSSASITGNTFYSNATISGTFANLAFVGNVFDGTGTKLYDNAAGQKTILGNVSTSGTTNKEVLANNYLKLGNGVSFGIKRFTGTLDSSGNALISHGIYLGHQAGLMVQAWCRGNSGEMVPIKVNYMDGGAIYITGGIASSRYRVTLMYSDEYDAW